MIGNQYPKNTARGHKTTGASRARNVLIVFAVIVVYLLVAWEYSSSSFKSLVYGYIDHKQHGKNDNYQLVGDVGGVPVSMSRTVIRSVTYDDEEHYKQQRKPIPLERDRTFKDKLASFGFDIRYPDMLLLTPEIRDSERGKSTIYTSMWLSVGVSSHSHFLGGTELALQRLVDYIPERFVFRGPEYRIYRRQPEPVHGLIAHSPFQRVVSSQGEVSWIPFADDDIYYHLDDKNQGDTYITCSPKTHAAAPCSQTFLLYPRLAAEVQITYRNGLLPHWQEIQQSVTKIIYGFAIKPEQIRLPK